MLVLLAHLNAQRAFTTDKGVAHVVHSNDSQVENSLKHAHGAGPHDAGIGRIEVRWPPGARRVSRGWSIATQAFEVWMLD